MKIEQKIMIIYSKMKLDVYYLQQNETRRLYKRFDINK